MQSSPRVVAAMLYQHFRDARELQLIVHCIVCTVQCVVSTRLQCTQVAIDNVVCSVQCAVHIMQCVEETVTYDNADRKFKPPQHSTGSAMH